MTVVETFITSGRERLATTTAHLSDELELTKAKLVDAANELPGRAFGLVSSASTLLSTSLPRTYGAVVSTTQNVCACPAPVLMAFRLKSGLPRLPTAAWIMQATLLVLRTRWVPPPRPLRSPGLQSPQPPPLAWARRATLSLCAPVALRA